MNTKLLSRPAQETMDQYLHFKVGAAECAVPYFNNKHIRQRAGLRAVAGKGSPREIFDEVEIQGMRENIRHTDWTNDLLKRFMCDNDIGIDCSGLAYYILDAEMRGLGKKALDRHLDFPDRSFLRRFIAKFRPAENADVLVFANDCNSAAIDWQKIQPGDFLTMTGSESERNHIVVVSQVDYQNFVPTSIHYTHSIAWPNDGQYGHGVRQGTIEVIDATKGLLDQRWTEKEKTGAENPTYLRAQTSKTEARRIK